MLFSTLTLAAALAGSVTASPVLLRRQGPGTDVPATPSNNGTAVGSSYLNATVESVPIGVTPGNWTQLTNATEPFPNGRLFIGEACFVAVDTSPPSARTTVNADQIYTAQATRRATRPT